MQAHQSTRSSSRAFTRFALVPAVVAVSLLAGCFGGDDDKPKAATQAAARVNTNEITVHQINLVLERQQGIKPEQADAASRQILEGLIDQEIAVQKAEADKLDRDPKIVQMLDATRRTLLARAYYEKVAGSAVNGPTSDEVKQYFDANPGLFSNRRIYMLQDFTIQGDNAQVTALADRLKSTNTVQDFADVLKASGLKFAVNQVTQPAESLPLGLVGRISQLQDGQSLQEVGQGGMKAILVVASRSQPLTFDQAKPLIERFLTETKRAEWLRAHVKELRDGAKVDYLGRFAEKPAGAASAPAVAVDVPPETAPATSPEAPVMDADALNKGLSGLK